MGLTPLPCSFPTFFLCLLEDAAGTLQPLLLPSARGEIPTHSRQGRVWSGWSDAGGTGLGWSRVAAVRGPPCQLLLAEQLLQEAHVVKQREMENSWAEDLAGFCGITWLGADLARGTAQACACGRKHSLHRLCLGGSQCSRE